MSNSPSIGIAVLTLNGKNHLPHCLPPLIHSPLQPKVLVIDSSSDDGTALCAEKLGATTRVIPRSQFNHGTTRELARRYLATDIVVMVTQDAYAVDNDAVGWLVKPLLNHSAVVSYGRQLPHRHADLTETFHRHFNYPEESQLRRLSDIPRYGKYTFFCSDSFAAYRNDALDAIGGFQSVLFGEDTLAVAQLLRRGGAIAYVAEAMVHHSHSYTLKQELQRHFDIGYSRHQHRMLLATPDGDSARGKDYARAFLRILWHQAPWQLPYGCLLLATKWLGYHLGTIGHHFPSSLNRRLSSHKSYWALN